MRLILLTLGFLLMPAALSAEPATRVILFAPFGIGGIQADLKVSSTVHGSCWISSLTSPRADAWRCATGNFIHDPCFSNTAETRVACPDLFSKRVLVIVLDKQLPRHEGATEPTPWALMLANGAKCALVSGATGVIAGMRLNYACNSKGWVLGEVDRSIEPWRVFYTETTSSSDYTRVSVRKAIL
jgi:hypothetical protein